LRERDDSLGIEEKVWPSGVFEPTISILSGLPPRSHKIRSPSIVVGRADTADLVLGHPEISRNHCRLFHEGGVWFIEDLVSRSGTMINGTRIDERTEIHEGDRIRVGAVTLLFGETRITFGATPYFVEPAEQPKRQLFKKDAVGQPESSTMRRPPNGRPPDETGRILTTLAEPILFFMIPVILTSSYGILVQSIHPYPQLAYDWWAFWSWLPGPVLFLSQPAGLLSFLGLAVFLWCGINWLLTSFSGWRRISNAYPARNRPQGKRFRGLIGSVGSTRYRLNADVTQDGLRLSVFPLYRFGHAPILIPWTAIHPTGSRRFLSSQYVSFDVSSPSIATICLPLGVLAASPPIGLFLRIPSPKHL
jgi:pSer/pThr/pTyr-binding forkhead associated (FHA) protein